MAGIFYLSRTAEISDFSLSNFIRTRTYELASFSLTSVLLLPRVASETKLASLDC